MNLTQFEDIQKVTQGICYKNGAFENCSNEIYNENILGLYQVHMKLWSSSICEIHSNFELDTTVKLWLIQLILFLQDQDSFNM